MEIKRFCGHERLPGGTRLWHRLARLAGFVGTVAVYGYGTGGIIGREQRRCYRTDEAGWTLGDWESGLIRIWLPCSCATVEFDADLDLARPHDLPLIVYAHELGHERQYQLGRTYSTDAAEEAIASRYGRRLLRSINYEMNAFN